MSYKVVFTCLLLILSSTSSANFNSANSNRANSNSVVSGNNGPSEQTLADDISNKQLQKQRTIYSNAVKLAKKGNRVDLEQYQESLKGYPLYPYLEYYNLLNTLKGKEIENFKSHFRNYGDLAVNGYLRKKLLVHLGNKKDWKNFTYFSAPFEDYISDDLVDILSCYQIEARIALEEELGPAPLSFYESIEEIWSQGESFPDECDSAIDAFRQSGLLSQALILKRLQLAIENKKYSLANYLSSQLDLENESQYQVWKRLRSRPYDLTHSDTNYQDTEFIRFSITSTLLTILKKDPPLTLTLWKELQKKVNFTEQESIKFTQDAAMQLIIARSSHASAWLEIANPNKKNSALNLKELVLLIKQNDWSAIISLYEKLSNEEKTKSIWQYWYSRSHIEDDQNDSIHPNAYRILNKLSKKRDYYGFLASFHLSNTPVISKHSFPVNDVDLKTTFQKPGIRRAHELYILGDYIAAAREWEFTTKTFNKEQKGTAAILASQWGWYEQAIRTASTSNQFDNMDLRFPLVFAADVNFYAAKYDLPNEWVFAVIRQESAFSKNAESRVGALGLMQLMPATAKELAKQNNLKRPKPSTILEPKFNISLGTYYLRQLRDRYDGNMLLASAAYNAGPKNVNSWIKHYHGVPIELWIETIPFKETRNYVKNILTYQIIYQRELGRNTNTEQLFLPIK